MEGERGGGDGFPVTLFLLEHLFELVIAIKITSLSKYTPNKKE